MKYEIVRNDERYPGLGAEYPSRVTTSEDCTPEQAKALAEIMTDCNPGCDEMFYVQLADEKERALAVKADAFKKGLTA